MKRVNPITRMDYPDPDVIRVGDTYYMLSTTLHFHPGAVILRSYDLCHWEIADYVFESLAGSRRERLQGERSSYGQGMWAGCLRFHGGTYYVSFRTPSSEGTYLFTASSIPGKWEKHVIEGIYHDGSLLFDRDGGVYMIHGNRQIWITQLRPDLTGPLEGGLSRVLLEDTGDAYLGYSAPHIYRVRDRYYLFVARWPKEGSARRTQLCFASSSLEGEFAGGAVLDDDRGYHNQGVAQGGIVDTPGGRWYAVLFQDHGAVGRIPVLVPVHWEGDFPVFGAGGRVPESIELVNSRPYYRYEPLYTSDDFCYTVPENALPQERPRLRPQWQWNHEPDNRLWSIREGGGLCIRTGKISANLLQAVNTLTQRTVWPGSTAQVTVDASRMKEGDYAGLCLLQGCYGMIGITRETGGYYLVVIARQLKDTSLGDLTADYLPGTLLERVKLSGPAVTLRAAANFEDMQDIGYFSYRVGKRFVRVGGKHRLYFKMDHLAGCRYGLYLYATRETGGEAVFTDFVYRCGGE